MFAERKESSRIWLDNAYGQPQFVPVSSASDYSEAWASLGLVLS